MNDRISDLMRLASAWGSDVPETEITAFLRLTADKREVAINRVAALHRLTTEPRPSTTTQLAEAKKLGIGVKRLQGLMRDWTNPRIEIVTPHGRVVRRQSRPSDGRDIAGKIIAKALSRNRTIAEPTVSRRLSKVCDRLGIAAPARMTVRRLLDAARRDLPPEPIAIESLSDEGRHPPRCGEVLLITSISFRAQIIGNEPIPKRAAALLLVDAGSGLIGAVDYRAGTAQLGRYVANLIRAGAPPLTYDWRRPRELIIAPPLPTGAWRKDVMIAADKLGIVVKDELSTRGRRWIADLQWRHPAGLDIAPGHPEAAPNPDWPTLSWAEFDEALEDAVREHTDVTERLLDERPFVLDAEDQSAAASADLWTVFGVEPA